MKTKSLQSGIADLRVLLGEARSMGVDVSHIKNEDKVDIAVVGVIKQGKSTFLNALLGGRHLPSKATVCTSVVTILEDSEKPYIEVVYKKEVDGNAGKAKRMETSDIYERLLGLVGRAGSGATITIDEQQLIREVRVGYPNPYAVEGVRIVDTPGVDDLDVWREQITFEYVQRCDAIVMLLNSTKAFSKYEKSFLEDKIQERIRKRIVIVVNRVDLIPDKEVDEVRERVKKLVGDLVPSAQVFMVSAKRALEYKMGGSTKDDGFDEFEKFFRTYMLQGRAGQLLTARYAALNDAVREKMFYHKKRMEDLDKDKKKVIEELKNEEKALKQKRKKYEELKESVVEIIRKCNVGLKEKLINVTTMNNNTTTDYREVFMRMRRDIVAAIEETVVDIEAEVGRKINPYLENIQPWKIDVSDAKDLPKFDYHRVERNSGSKGDITAMGVGLGLAAGILTLASGGLLAGLFGAVIGAVSGGAIGKGVEEQVEADEENRAYRDKAIEYQEDLRKNAKDRTEKIMKDVKSNIMSSMDEAIQRVFVNEEMSIKERRKELNGDARKIEKRRMGIEIEIKELDDLLMRAKKTEGIYAVE